jgi:hypothetical protein
MGIWVILSGAMVAAQVAPAAKDGETPTLHVYTDLIQIPVLVLGANRERVAPIAGNRFAISLDSGPRFRVTHVRQEGDDPISLAIVLDVSGYEAELMPKMDDLIAGLAPLSLRPKDRVSTYALDCSLTRSADDIPPEPARLKLAVDEALESWILRKRTKHRPDCKQSIHLWDSLIYVTEELSKLPGRRVILVVTDGNDLGSRHGWNDVRFLAQTKGVAIFGMTEMSTFMLPSYQRRPNEDPFNAVCELSGGVVVFANKGNVAERLKGFTVMLRERYIVEFPRPVDSKGGEHDLIVSIDKSHYFIRPSGISVPITDPALLADPTTVRADPSHAPEFGSRKVLVGPH